MNELGTLAMIGACSDEYKSETFRGSVVRLTARINRKNHKEYIHD